MLTGVNRVLVCCVSKDEVNVFTLNKMVLVIPWDKASISIVLGRPCIAKAE